MTQSLSVAMVIFLIYIVIIEYKRTRELVNPLFIFATLSIVDLYLPSLIYLNFGISGLPPWVYISRNNIKMAVFVFSISVFMFILGYFLVSLLDRRKDAIVSEPWIPSVNIKIVKLVFVISAVWYILYIWHSAEQIGGISQYFDAKLHLRWVASPQINQSKVWGFVNLLSTSMLNIMFISTGMLFYMRKKLKNRYTYTYFIPIITWIFSLTTFYRGTQIEYFLGLLVIEVFRVKDLTISIASNTTIIVSNQNKKSKRRIYVLLSLGVLVFLTYGAIRAYYSSEQWGTQITFEGAVSTQLKGNLSGSSLIGLASILRNYSGDIPLLYGKTIFSMLLLPIPRSIWHSKPSWYGIDEITRGMGWPDSTQSAVSMPGELFANFGTTGLIGMVVYGLLFGIIFRSRKSVRMRFIYPFGLLPIVFVTYWMSFTGFMNSIIQLPLAYIMIILTVKKQYLKERVIQIVSEDTSEKEQDNLRFKRSY